MFGFLRRSVDSSVTFCGGFNSLQKDFLECADEAYTMTFKQLDMSHFAKYASRSLYITIYRSLSLERPWASVSNKFKNTTWTLLAEDSKGFVASKATVFDKVNVTRQLKLSVADDYKEFWFITKNNKGDFIVDNISQSSEVG